MMQKYREAQLLPKATFRTRSVAFLLTLTLSGFGMSAVPRVAHADEPAPSSATETVAEAEDTVAAAESVAGDLVADPASGVIDVGDGTLTVTESGSTAVDNDPFTPVALASNDGLEVSIGLPNQADLESGVVTEEGATVYDGTDSSIVVIPTDDGVQALITIDDASAPTEYSFPVEIPAGANFAINEDGSVSVVDEAGNVVGGFEAPWATDANGVEVPTRFELVDGALTQIVDFHAGDFAFPIIADPSWWWWASTAASCVFQVGTLFALSYVALGAKIKKVESAIAKSASAAKYVRELGGVKRIVEHLKELAKGKKMTDKQKAAYRGLAGLAFGLFIEFFGIGSCISLVREWIK